MKKILSLCVLVGFAMTVGIYLFLYPYSDRPALAGGQVIFLDRVSTLAAHQTGLGGRTSLCNRCGMLFLFGRAGTYGFWMKGMVMDIDIVWLRDGRVVHIEEHVPFTTPEKQYTPKESADSVLELGSGRARALGITLGDEIRF